MWSSARVRLSLWGLLLGLGWLAASCIAPIISVGPGIWVVVDAEPELGVQLDRIELATDRDGTTLWLKDPPLGERRGSLPVLRDLKWEKGRFRDALHVRGYRGKQLLVERSADLTFSAERRLVLKVFLTRACAELVGVCEDKGETCVDCTGACGSDRLPAEALRSVDFDENPLSGYERPACSGPALGPDLTNTQISDEEPDAGLDAGPGALEEASVALDGQAALSDASATTTDAVVLAEASAQAGAEAGASSDAAVAGVLQQCVLLLPMDEAQWSGVPGEVRDQSGLGHHGSAAGSAQTSANGHFGRAAQLDGSGWVSVPDAPALRPAGALSVSAWFYLDQAPTNWPGIVAKRIGFGMDSSFALFLSPESWLYVDVAGEESRFHSNAVISAQTWHHVAFTFNGSAPSAERVRLYLDGVLDRSAPEMSSSIPPYTGDIMVGNLNNGGDVFVGRIDEVALWTRVLSDSEIRALATASAPL